MSHSWAINDDGGMTGRLFAEILRDTHAYCAGIDLRRPTLVADSRAVRRRGLRLAREHARDSLERVASRAGFAHAHFDPAEAGLRLARLAELSAGLQETYSRLRDDDSRRALIDVLKFRVLGPYHARLAVTPEGFRKEQARLDRERRVEAGTFEVSDPWFSPLSHYRIPVTGNRSIELHAHSVDIVSVFLHEQYSYTHASAEVRVEAGDVVFDVGGCWGDTALYFADLVGPKGKVYTFEFDPESLDILRTNLSLNPELAARIEIVERALWDRSGETLEVAPGGRCTSLSEGSGNAINHQVVTLTVDDFVDEAGIERVDFIKMDVEGAEANVLRGAHESLGAFQPRLAIAAYHKDDDLVTIPNAIASAHAGYGFYLESFSPVEDETVLFGLATRRNNST